MGQPQSTRRRDTFRADVQALRAVAVVGVLIYHLWPKRLTGGFVGVDVFYVISGYLITQHLMREVNATGRIRLTQFWARRIRRLFPAAFAVLIACAALLLLTMPPVTWAENVREIAASALYFENWMLAFHSVDYLASSDSASIVQHYWSLSVEEQFYFVWPLLLLAALLLAQRSKRLGPSTVAVIVLASISVLSLGASIIATERSPAFAFFATYTRMWEFGLGGLVALMDLPRSLDRLPFHQAATSVGFALIAGSMFFISDRLPFPGAVALFPTIGTALVLRSRLEEGRLLIRVVSWRWVQWAGDCSYSIYLWHWPLIIAAPWALKSTISWPVKLIIFVMTLVLAGLSKRYIEDPNRTRRSWTLNRWPNYAFAAAGMGAAMLLTGILFTAMNARNREVASKYRRNAAENAPCFGAAALKNARACARPFRPPSANELAFAAADIGSLERCRTERNDPKLTLCEVGELRRPRRTIILVGNSHAVRLVPALKAYGERRGWKIMLAAKIDCMGLSSTAVGTQTSADTCPTWTASLQKWILARRPDAVIFATHAAAQKYLAGSNADAMAIQIARGNVLSAWRTYVRAGIPIVVLGDVPGTRPLPAPECIAKSEAAYDPCAEPANAVVKGNFMTDVAEAYPRLVTYQPLAPLLCDARLCHSVIGGVVVYSDSHHLTETYSRTMGRYLGPAIDRAMNR